MPTTSADEIFTRRPYLLNAAASQVAGELGCTERETERLQMAARAEHQRVARERASEQAITSVKAKLRLARRQADDARGRAETETNPLRTAQARLAAAQHDERAAALDARLRGMASGRRLAAHLRDVETR